MFSLKLTYLVKKYWIILIGKINAVGSRIEMKGTAQKFWFLQLATRAVTVGPLLIIDTKDIFLGFHFGIQSVFSFDPLLNGFLENLFDIDVVFGTGVVVRKAPVVETPLIRFFLADLPPVDQIDFVPEDYKREVVRILNVSIVKEFLSP